MANVNSKTDVAFIIYFLTMIHHFKVSLNKLQRFKAIPIISFEMISRTFCQTILSNDFGRVLMHR